MSGFPTIGNCLLVDGDEGRDPTDESEPECFRFFSKASCSERMFDRRFLLGVEICCKSGKVRVSPSIKREERRALFGDNDGLLAIDIMIVNSSVEESTESCVVVGKQRAQETI